MEIVKVKAYLNERLKPKVYLGEYYYPVYLRFNYKGSNHQISSNSIGYLKNENELNNYKESIKEEIFHINNFIKINNGEFDIKIYNDYYLKNALKLISYVIKYFESVNSEFYNYYYRLMQDYLFENTNFNKDFLSIQLKNNFVAFTTKLPDFFIDRQDEKYSKLIEEIDFYNYINNCSREINRDLNYYDWIFRGIRDEVLKENEKYFQLMEKCLV